MDEQLSQCPTQPTQPTQIISQTQLEPPRPPANIKKVWGRLRRFFPVPGEPAEIEFDPELDEFTVGRHRECEFVVGDVRASNRHCTFLKAGQKDGCAFVSLKDTSTNGTFVNGELIARGDSFVLTHKDVICLSMRTPKLDLKTLAFIYEDPQVDGDDDDSDHPQARHILRLYHITERELGRGAFSIVKLAFDRHQGTKVAVKIVDRSRLVQPRLQRSLMDEIRILQNVNHPCIVSILNVADSSRNVFLFLEYVSGGELFDKLRQQRMSERDVKVYAMQIVLTLQYLHSQNIVHRDLKPENILLQQRQRYAAIKIADFGLARILGDELMMTSLCGTPSYLAPEVFTQPYSKAVDCWSLGVILYTMLTGLMPFPDDGGIETLVVNAQSRRADFTLAEWKDVSPEAADLVQRLLQPSPQQRYTLEQVMQHPWMRDSEVLAVVEQLMEPVSAEVPDAATVINSDAQRQKRSVSADAMPPPPSAKRLIVKVEQPGTV